LFEFESMGLRGKAKQPREKEVGQAQLRVSRERAA
jgi:hypothetical protein